MNAQQAAIARAQRAYQKIERALAETARSLAHAKDGRLTAAASDLALALDLLKEVQAS